MTAFWLIAGSMLAFALLCVAWPLAHRPDERGARDSRSLLVTLYQDELARADAEFHEDALSKELHEATRCEIEARLLDDVESSQVRQSAANVGDTGCCNGSRNSRSSCRVHPCRRLCDVSASRRACRTDARSRVQ